MVQQIVYTNSTDLFSVKDTGNITLTLDDGPYIINRNGTLNSSVHIENGVSIIFDGDYQLTINGNVDAGCFEYDTTEYHNAKMHWKLLPRA